MIGETKRVLPPSGAKSVFAQGTLIPEGGVDLVITQELVILNDAKMIRIAMEDAVKENTRQAASTPKQEPDHMDEMNRPSPEEESKPKYESPGVSARETDTDQIAQEDSMATSDRRNKTEALDSKGDLANEESIDQMQDDQLIAFIYQKTGKAPHANTSRNKLLKMAKEHQS
jgi:hypothetical protein